MSFIGVGNKGINPSVINIPDLFTVLTFSRGLIIMPLIKI